MKKGTLFASQVQGVPMTLKATGSMPPDGPRANRAGPALPAGQSGVTDAIPRSCYICSVNGIFYKKPHSSPSACSTPSQVSGGRWETPAGDTWGWGGRSYHETTHCKPVMLYCYVCGLSGLQASVRVFSKDPHLHMQNPIGT